MKRYERAPLTGGLLNHNSRGELAPRILDLEANSPMSLKDESAFQQSVFNFLRLNQPRIPLKQHVVQLRGKNKGGRRIELVPDVGTREWDEYISHPLYLLTRVRHFPNGGHRHTAVAGKLKAEGVRPGAFDIFLDAARRGYHGCRIEQKAGKNGPEQEQLEELAWLRREGYFAHFAWTDCEAIALLLYYAEIPFSAVQGLHHRTAIPVPYKGGHDARCPDCTLKIKGWWS